VQQVPDLGPKGAPRNPAPPRQLGVVRDRCSVPALSISAPTRCHRVTRGKRARSDACYGFHPPPDVREHGSSIPAADRKLTLPGQSCSRSSRAPPVGLSPFARHAPADAISSCSSYVPAQNRFLDHLRGMAWLGTRAPSQHRAFAIRNTDRAPCFAFAEDHDAFTMAHNRQQTFYSQALPAVVARATVGF